MIEVEVRAFINEEDYERLKEFFEKNARLIKEDEQETHYFDCEQDLRIQQASDYAKVWLKKGRIHDEHREEIEIKVRREEFNELKKLFKALGYEVKVKWLRKRIAYAWKGITVYIDNTKGYGKIIELEKLTNENNKIEILNELKNEMKALGIKITPRQVFEQRFNEYLRNWKKLKKD